MLRSAVTPMPGAIALFALFALLSGPPHRTEAAEALTGRHGGDGHAIARCVLEAPDRARPLQTLAGGIVLATHPCNGGLYLIPARERAAAAPPAAMGRAIPLHEGWWLFDLIGADLAEDGTLDVRARFISGIGPGAATPFAVRIRARREAGHWRVDEPVPIDDPVTY